MEPLRGPPRIACGLNGPVLRRHSPSGTPIDARRSSRPPETKQNQWTDIPDANAKVTVPARWTQALILVRFESDNIFSNCSVSNCQVQITVDGVVMEPDVADGWGGGSPTRSWIAG